MMAGTILLYDGTFNGFLTCIFSAFEQKLEVNGIYTEATRQEHMFAEPLSITTNSEKAERVISGLKRKISNESYREISRGCANEKYLCLFY